MAILKDLADNPDKVFIFVICVVVELLAIGGNLLIIEAVRRKRALRSTTNILLANVALSDLVCCAFLPLMLVQRTVQMKNGLGADLLCKLLIDYHVPVTASTAAILTLTVVSVERYNAIVKPMKVASRLTKDTVHLALIAVWVASVVITIPLYIYGHYQDKDRMCKHNYPSDDAFIKISLIPFVILVLLLPLIVTLFCYFKIYREIYNKNQVAAQNDALAEEDRRTRKKLTKVCLTTTAVNTISFMPLLWLGILRSFKIVSKRYLAYGLGLYFIGIGLNPLVYAIQSSNFCQAFKEILCRKVVQNNDNLQDLQHPA